uniref:Uncharacterized protein n=1 Tax=Vespula pensylvanica TaxID=30213 RepID=A0A834UDQ8_VESPE|nr:hypothetical protein H0235_005211 [Vespula pensylvanica]
MRRIWIESKEFCRALSPKQIARAGRTERDRFNEDEKRRHRNENVNDQRHTSNLGPSNGRFTRVTLLRKDFSLRRTLRMDGWMDGWMDGRIDGRTDEWMEKENERKKLAVSIVEKGHSVASSDNVGGMRDNIVRV